MCGIAGAFAYGPDSEPVDQDVILRLNDLQRRRGPDGDGFWASEDQQVALGHRRLAIIDTGLSGAQPMTDVTGRWVITFNGEIYNYRALRNELEQLGCAFRTNSDTEVLINAVAQWGELALRKLRGMYAFALWDSRERELWLVRDPYGIKPLYVADNGKAIWFASQARPLSVAAPVNTARDAAALTGFYLWGHVPEPFSWWAGIRMLPAGHVQRIRAGKMLLEPVAFTRVQHCYMGRPAEPLAPGELRALMLDSIRHHLVADVPVGVFLSAGIDSNVIAALAAELGSGLRTVTLAFNEYAGTADNEAPLAETAAKLLGCEHNIVRVGREEFELLIEDFLKCMDQPTVDGLNTYLISRAAAQQGLKVVLSGLGGDELFGGYPSFRQIPQLLKWGNRVPLPKLCGRALHELLRVLPVFGIAPKAAGLLSHSTDIANAYLLRRALYLEDELGLLLDRSWLNEGLERLSTLSALAKSIRTLHNAKTTVHAQVAALESCWYMRNQLLRDTDWSSMAHGLEVRVPFVDWVLLEHLGPSIASTAPPSKKDLVASCAPQLPPGIVKRRKTGFTTPVRRWITGSRRGSRGMRGWAADVHRRFRAPPSIVPSTSSHGKIPSGLNVVMLLTDGFGGLGGISKFNRDFLHALDSSQSVKRVHALPRVIPEFIQEAIPESVIYERAAARGKGAFLRRLASLAWRNERIDLVVCGHIHLLAAAWMLARCRGARLALVIHGVEAWTPGRRLASWLADTPDAIVAVSKYSMEQFNRWSKLPIDRAFILPNCVDLDRFTPGHRDAQLAKRYGLQSSKVILTVGRLASDERYKGFDQVIELMPKLLKRFPNLKYLVVGEGDDRSRLEVKARALKVSESVVFAGRIPEDEKVAHYNLADVYAMPSTGEGFGIVLVEAAACGIPVVGSRVDGSHEALLDGRLGRLIDPRSQIDLDHALTAALAEKRERKRIGLVEAFSVQKFKVRVADWCNLQSALMIN